MSETVIDSLVLEVKGTSDSAAKEINELSSALNNLRASAKLTTVINNLNKLSTSLSTLSNSNTGLKNISQLANSLSGLTKLGDMSNLKNAANSLKNITNVIAKLDDKTLSQFTTQMNRLSSALTPLSSQLTQVGTAFSRLPSNITKATKAATAYNSTASRTTKSNSKLIDGLFGVVQAFGVPATASLGIGLGLKAAISETNAYIENMNMFTVSMGEYASAAESYAERVQDAMGIDMSEWVRNQAIFMNMAAGFGVARDEAYQMSKGLTELAYDISSFYNTPIEEAFTRLQSGIAGEIEPVRRWGIALDQASMQQWMYKNGIDATVNSLDQGSKAMIRYNMIVEAMASNNAIGDMARTLASPANAIRILSQQITQLARAIGSILIPVLSAVLPYIQAFVKVVTMAVTALAALFGIKLQPLDFSTGVTGLGGVSSAAGDAADAVGGVGDAIGGATKKAKELKDATMGFDELNIISPPEPTSGSGGGGGGVGGGGGGLDLGLDPLSVWDESIFDQINSKVDELVPKMKVLLGIAAAIGAAMLAWKIGNALYDAYKYIQAIRKAATGFPDLAKAMFDEGELTKGKSRFLDFTATVSNAARSAATSFSSFAPAIANALSAASAQIVAFGGVLKANLVAGCKRAASSLKAMATSVSAAMKPYLPLIAVVAALTAAIAYLWQTDEEFRNTMIECGNEIKSAFMPVLENLKTAFMEIVEALGPALASLAGAIGDLIVAIAPMVGEILAQMAPLLAQIVPLITQVVTQIVNSLAPVMPTLITALQNFISAIAPAISSFLQNLLPLIMQIVSFILQKVVPILTDIVVWVINMVSGIIEALTPIISFVADLLGKIIGFVADFISNVADFIANLKDNVIAAWESIKESAETVWTGIRDFIKGIIDGIKNIITPIVEFVRGIWNKAKDITHSIWESIKNAIKSVFDSIKGIIEAIVTPVKNTFGKVQSIISGVFKKIQDSWKGLGKFVSGVTDGIASAFNSVVSRFKSIVNVVIRGINSAIGIINLIPGVEISRIPQLAEGTNNWMGGFAVMNEYGRGELVNLPNGSQVIPHDVSMEYARKAAELSSTQPKVENYYMTTQENDNGEQLAVLREQNAILREILSKDTSIKLDGKTLTKAVEKHQATRGTVIMPGGVKYGY